MRWRCCCGQWTDPNIAASFGIYAESTPIFQAFLELPISLAGFRAFAAFTGRNFPLCLAAKLRGTQ
jgi:hypothetical protein